MNNIDLFNQILKQIKQVQKNKPQDKTLPCNVYYLDDGLIFCGKRKDGDSRYPYAVDGLTLWAHSSGYISINESNFFFIAPTLEGKEPTINFYGGIKKEDGNFDYHSILGLCDPHIFNQAETYCVYSKHFVIYIKEVDDIIFASKLAINDDKEILISNFAINNNKETKTLFLSSFINAIMEHNSCESDESKWFKKCELLHDGCYFLGVEDISRELHLTNYAIIKRHVDKNYTVSSSTSRSEFTGSKHNSMIYSPCLLNGKHPNNKKVTLFSETSAFSDIVSYDVKPNSFMQVDYKINLAFSKGEFEKYSDEKYLNNNDSSFNALLNKTNEESEFEIKFGKLNNINLNEGLLNNFLNTVKEQVNYGANAKNSSLRLLGIRDVYQMIECSLMWDDKQAKKRILQSLNFIDETGRCPRQYSIPTSNENPLMDNREFIDQGQWIISTVFQYLAYTNDLSILDCECGYVNLIGRNSAQILNKKDSVYDHLLRIINYLINNIDKDSYCLKTLYGDWNDAVDGLGTSSDKSKPFGNGVSSMATFHLYKNLIEMSKIVSIYNKDTSLSNEYLNIAKKIEKGVNDNLIHTKGNDKKIIHGWGENKSFYVGSFNDVDNKSRDSLTSNAFYVIGGLYEHHKDMKPYILNAYKRLDSKYGLMTFNEFFDKDAYKVGRIINLPKGTAENAATYIHGSMFGVKSLFMMNEGELAFEQIFKLLPITHSYLSTTPFVMPNSYIYNTEIGVDGESMSDWFTGSSNTLLKLVISDVFGLQLDLGNIIYLKPSNYFPSDLASLKIKAKGKHLTINYINNHNKERIIKVNDEVLTNNYIDVSEYKDVITIDIID